jgi:hypothetical protein
VSKHSFAQSGLTVQEALQLAGFMYLEGRYEDSEQVLLKQINSGVRDTTCL